MERKSLLCRMALLSFFKIISYKALWRSTFSCLASIFKNFFALQSFAVFFPKRVTVSYVDHPLDAEIPFKPDWVHIYMDFSAFWVRIQGFLLEKFGKDAIPQVNDFLDTVTVIYRNAASVSKRNFSTTRRPRYYGTFKFALIHLFDPHLMCIPSLHVMMVICTFAKFKKSLNELNCADCYHTEITWARNYALSITESILYVKQHSVNCIPAALYAMTSFDSSLFNTALADEFIADLFMKPDNIDETAVVQIKKYITDLYARFIEESQSGENWQEPLIRFLRNGRPKECG